MTIATICKKNVITIGSESSIQEAARLMKKNNIGDVLVEDNGKLVGILTDRDIVIRLAADDVEFTKVKVGDVMSEQLLTLKSNLSIMDAVKSLSSKGVRRAPVVDELGKPCGVISIDDLLVLLINELQKISKVLQTQMH